jgi:hypothetical protein
MRQALNEARLAQAYRELEIARQKLKHCLPQDMVRLAAEVKRAEIQVGLVQSRATATN